IPQDRPSSPSSWKEPTATEKTKNQSARERTSVDNRFHRTCFHAAATCLHMPATLTPERTIDIGRRSPAFPVTPPCVRVRTRRFGELSSSDHRGKTERSEVSIGQGDGDRGRVSDPTQTWYDVGCVGISS